jgi:ribonuclease-3
MQLCFRIVTNVLSAEGEQRVKNVGTNIQLEKVACKWNLQDCVVGNPCQKGEVPRELLASTVEAIIGAVWIDSQRNLRDVQQVLSALYS